MLCFAMKRKKDLRVSFYKKTHLMAGPMYHETLCGTKVDDQIWWIDEYKDTYKVTCPKCAKTLKFIQD